MMNFIVLTISFTLAILLAGVISTVVLFTAMNNVKFIKWLMGYYMKQFENSCKAFDLE